MSSRLANTIFSGSGKETMLVQDAYKVSTSEPRNSLFDTVKGIYGDAVSGLYANKNSVRELASIIAQAKSGNINKAEMLERALGAMGTSLPSLLGQLGGTIMNGISGAAGSLIGPNAAKDIGIIYNNAKLLVSVKDISNAQDMADFLGELTGNSDLLRVINIEAESSIFAGILTQVVSFGIPGLVDDVVAQIQNEEVKKNALQYLSSSSVNGSDLVMINKIIDTIGITAFLEQNPDGVNRTLSNFFFGTLDTPDTYPAKRAQLIATLVKIDPHWSETLRNSVYVPYLGPFSVASTDAKKLLVMEEPERALTLAAAQFQAAPVRDVIKNLYPDAFIS